MGILSRSLVGIEVGEEGREGGSIMVWEEPFVVFLNIHSFPWRRGCSQETCRCPDRYSENRFSGITKKRKEREKRQDKTTARLRLPSIDQPAEGENVC